MKSFIEQYLKVGDLHFMKPTSFQNMVKCK